MKKFFAIAAVVIATVFSANAEVFTNWHGIDQASVEQQLDITGTDVYLYAHTSAQPKNDHQASKQQAAFDELGKTLQIQLKGAFGRSNIILINSLDEAPADAVVIDANLTDIDWGSGVLRQTAGFGAGSISATYDVTITNAKGLVCQFHNRRFHDTTFSSAKGAAVIKVYNKAIAKDLITALMALK